MTFLRELIGPTTTTTTGGASSADLTTLKADVKSLGDRTTVLEARHDVVTSDQPPDYSRLDWRIWSQHERDAIAWTMTVVDYDRIDNDSSMPMKVRVEPLPDPTHADARTNANGDFENDVPGGGTFTYRVSRSGGLNGFEFPPDVYKSAIVHYVDAAGNAIAGTERGQMIAAGSTALGMGIGAAPTEAVAYIARFVKVDNSVVSYRVPV